MDKDKNIQMLTALVLQLIQCVVILPDKLGRKKEKGNKKEKVCSDCNILFNITMRNKQDDKANQETS